MVMMVEYIFSDNKIYLLKLVLLKRSFGLDLTYLLEGPRLQRMDLYMQSIYGNGFLNENGTIKANWIGLKEIILSSGEPNSVVLSVDPSGSKLVKVSST